MHFYNKESNKIIFNTPFKKNIKDLFEIFSIIKFINISIINKIIFSNYFFFNCLISLNISSYDLHKSLNSTNSQFQVQVNINL